MLKSILACSLAALVMVFADRIVIDSPNAAKFSEGSQVDISYSIHKGDMRQIRSASATLVESSSGKKVATFPSVEWNGEGAAHDTWTVPSGLAAGKYDIIVEGKGTVKGEEFKEKVKKTIKIGSK